MASPKLPFLSLLLFVCSFITTFRCIKAHESDRVINLPGQPSSSSSLSHFSGYITVNQNHGRALFYWFFEAQSQPSNKPLLLWFNGGPGCSSIGYGAAAELGPLRVNGSGSGLEFNKHSWNREANLMFVESPVGVGFSYTNTSADFAKLDDGFVAEDAYNFLVNWMKRFPQYKTHDFFISGESYAGHYVPQLAELVYDRNKDRTKYPFINLKGFILRFTLIRRNSLNKLKKVNNPKAERGVLRALLLIMYQTAHSGINYAYTVGNPETNDYYDYKGILEYAWSHSVISDQEFENAKQVCDFKVSQWSGECNAAMSVVFAKYNEIDIYNIYAPICLLNTSSSSSSSSKAQNYGLRMRLRGGYDPCYSTHIQQYFSRVDVQTSLHANTRGGGNHGYVDWKVCSDSVFNEYNYNVFSVMPIYTKLIKGGLKIWIYSGDTDGRVPVIGSRYCIEALGLPLKSPWRSWYHNHQVGGRIVEYEGLTYVTVRGAGHLVPLNKPSEALSLIHSFLSGQDLPAHR